MNKQEQLDEIIEITNMAVHLNGAMKMALVDTLTGIPNGEKTLDSVLLENQPQLESRMRDTYDTFYTDEEVAAMHAYYSSPIGRSISDKAHNMIPELHKVGGEWGKAVAEALKDRLVEENTLIMKSLY